MSPEDMSRPAHSLTLAEAVSELVYLIECAACKHKTQIDLAAMATKLGDGFRVQDLRPRLKCAQCGSRNTIATTLWISATTTNQFVRRFLGID